MQGNTCYDFNNVPLARDSTGLSVESADGFGCEVYPTAITISPLKNLGLSYRVVILHWKILCSVLCFVKILLQY